MRSNTDAELLQEYSSSRSESAFGEIVRRYADLVYSAAVRQVGDEDQARDVAQTVFLDLARKAGSLRRDTLLIGWLFRGTRLAALQQLRTDRRRLQRERHAMEWIDHSTDAAVDWTVLRPVLDEAIASLGAEDRDALLLRFFKNEPLARVGVTLGVSEDAAQKRVSRALGKLREFLAGRGIGTSSAALAMSLTAHAVQHAPAGLAAALATKAITTAATAGGSAAANLLTITNMKTAILVLTLTAGAAAFTVSSVNSHRQMREAQARVREQQEQLDLLRAANDELAGQTNELAQLREDTSEVLRLRAELTRLQNQKPAAARIATAEPTSTQSAVPEKSTAPSITITAKFVTLPSDALKSLASAGLPHLANGSVMILNSNQFGIIDEALKGANDVEIINQPRVLTASGTPASLSSTESIPFDGTNASVGTQLSVNPEVDGPNIGLGLEARFTQIKRDVTTPDNRRDVLETIKMSANVKMVEGLTAVLTKALPQDAGLDPANAPAPRSLVVFVTPTLGHRAEFTDRLQALIVRASDTNEVNGTRAGPR